MDKRLEDKLTNWHKQVELLERIEREYLNLKAHEKVMYSQLFLKVEGKNNAEKEARVYSSKDWDEFSKGLVEATARVNKEKRRLELLIKAFDAEYVTYKIEAQAIKRSL